MAKIAHLADRAVLAITGNDRVSFLQGLVSNDVTLAAPGRAVWAALLTPQGKYLADFFILDDGAQLLLDTERAGMADLSTRLSRYRLRADVQLRPTDLSVFAAWDGLPENGSAIIAPDPRLPAAGWRLLAADLHTTATFADWDLHRLALGLPDGSRDMERDRTVLLEAGFDALGGVSWDKGCYMGQELTARTRYRGLLKRRLVTVDIDGPLPAPGTPVLRGDGLEVGTMRSGLGARGMAVIRLDAIELPLTAGEARLTARLPDWASRAVLA